MEIRAYNELYLEDAMSTMGTMLDYAVNYCNWEIDEFFQTFLDTRLFPPAIRKRPSRNGCR